jgi:hypothetical protein
MKSMKWRNGNNVNANLLAAYHEMLKAENINTMANG